MKYLSIIALFFAAIPITTTVYAEGVGGVPGDVVDMEFSFLSIEPVKLKTGKTLAIPFEIRNNYKGTVPSSFIYEIKVPDGISVKTDVTRSDISCNTTAANSGTLIKCQGIPGKTSRSLPIKLRLAIKPTKVGVFELEGSVSSKTNNDGNGKNNKSSIQLTVLK